MDDRARAGDHGPRLTLRTSHSRAGARRRDREAQPDSPVKRMQSQVVLVLRRMWGRQQDQGECLRLTGLILGAASLALLLLLALALALRPALLSPETQGHGQTQAGLDLGANSVEGLARLIDPMASSSSISMVGNAKGGALGREGNRKSSSASPLDSKRRSSLLWGKKGPGAGQGKHTAVCLVGAGRQFEATGPSIALRLIQSYTPADVFLHSPLDSAAAKLWGLLLGPAPANGSAPAWPPGASLAAVRIFANADVDEALHPTSILRVLGSPQREQGLLQYFRLVEGCLDLVLQHQQRTGRVYRWIVRARVDSFWGMPAPSLKGFDSRAYNVPFGHDFGGLNDRFGIGPPHTAETAMRRLSLLDKIQAANASRSYNSEGAYRMQFKVSKIQVVRRHVPFCVVTHRWPRPYGHCNPAFVALETAALIPLDGAKCLPCKVCAERQADDVMLPLYKNMGLTKKSEGVWLNADKVQVCNLSRVWAEGAWQPRFDAVVGPELALRRQLIMNASLDKCISMFSKMQSLTLRWDAPDPKALCLRRSLGPAKHVGGKGLGAYPTMLRLITSQSLVVSVRPRPADEDQSWSSALTRLTGARVLSWNNARLKAFVRGGPSPPHKSMRKVALLKLPRQGLSILLRWVRKQYHPEVCQVLVSVPKAPTTIPAVRPFPAGLTAAWEHLAAHGLERSRAEYAGFELDSCIGGRKGTPLHCLFFSVRHC